MQLKLMLLFCPVAWRSLAFLKFKQWGRKACDQYCHSRVMEWWASEQATVNVKKCGCQRVLEKKCRFGVVALSKEFWSGLKKNNCYLFLVSKSRRSQSQHRFQFHWALAFTFMSFELNLVACNEIWIPPVFSIYVPYVSPLSSQRKTNRCFPCLVCGLMPMCIYRGRPMPQKLVCSCVIPFEGYHWCHLPWCRGIT